MKNETTTTTATTATTVTAAPVIPAGAKVLTAKTTAGGQTAIILTALNAGTCPICALQAAGHPAPAARYKLFARAYGQAGQGTPARITSPQNAAKAAALAAGGCGSCGGAKKRASKPTATTAAPVAPAPQLRRPKGRLAK